MVRTARSSWGWKGRRPKTVDTQTVLPRVAAAREAGSVRLLGKYPVALTAEDLVLHRRQSLPFHPNGMRFTAFAQDGSELRSRTYYSVGGGFVVDEEAAGADRIKVDDTVLRYPFITGEELCRQAKESGLRTLPRSAWNTTSD